MYNDEMYELCKRMLPQILDTEQQGDSRYMFIVDNGEIAEAIIAFGYQAVVITNDSQLQEMEEIFRDNYIKMTRNNIRVIPLCKKSVADRIAKALDGKGILPCKCYSIYGKNKAYYEANPDDLREPLAMFIRSLENQPVEGGLKYSPDGLILANPKENSYKAIAEHIIDTYDIVNLDGELHIRKEGRFYELYTQEKNDSVLLNSLYNSSANFRKELYTYIKTFAPQREISKDIIPFLNCVYDCNKLDIEDYTEDMYLTGCIPHRVNSAADEPEILRKFLDDISSGDEEIETLLVEIVAYCLISGNPWQKMFFIYGRGGNGKSTFFDLLEWLFGADNMAYKSWSDLSEAKGRYGIEDKRIVICDDESDAFVKNTRALKVLTSGEPLSIKRLYENEYTVSFRGKIISSGNEIPKTSDRSNGWMRRLVLIPFEGDFRNKPDINLSRKLRTEEVAEGLILYALVMLPRLLKNGFSVPKRVRRLMGEYRVENNHVIQFVEEMGNRFAGKENAKVLSVIHQTYYCNFCKTYLYRPMSFMQFAKVMNGIEGIRFYRPHGTGKKLYYYEPEHTTAYPYVV